MSDAARERRAAERRRRRGSGKEAPPDGAVDTAELVEGLRNAASAAAVGAAVGAARAIASRRGERDETPEEAPEDGDPEATQEPQDSHEPPGADEAPYEQEPQEQEQQEEQPQAATPGEVREQVRRARELMRDLHSADAESVSSVVRGANGWTVGLEVVEVRRIPDSTDVLATYEVQLDDDGCILRFERVRRYHRSEAQRGGRA